MRKHIKNILTETTDYQDWYGQWANYIFDMNEDMEEEDLMEKYKDEKEWLLSKDSIIAYRGMQVSQLFLDMLPNNYFGESFTEYFSIAKSFANSGGQVYNDDFDRNMKGDIPFIVKVEIPISSINIPDTIGVRVGSSFEGEIRVIKRSPVHVLCYWINNEKINVQEI